jgi:hypothetical protein
MKKEHLPLKIGVNAEVVVALLISIMFQGSSLAGGGSEFTYEVSS